MALKWEAVVFDLDGTLADTLRDLAESANTALERSGCPPHPVDSYRHMVGDGVRRLVERAAGPQAAEPQRRRILADFLAVYDRDCLRYARPYPGMTETLDALKRDGLRILAVTNKPEAQALKIIRHLFGERRFDGVYGNAAGRKTKPDPALTLQALSAVGADARRSLFVGDSDVDMYTAANAGMPGAGAVWGFRGEQELRGAGALYILHKPAEILNTY